jgi:hypothetical protein
MVPLRYIEWIKRNPVIVLDIVKYLAAGLVLFGIPVPAGLDVVIAGLVLAGLSIATRQLVTPNGEVEKQVDEALHTPAPEPYPVPEYVPPQSGSEAAASKQ